MLCIYMMSFDPLSELFQVWVMKSVLPGWVHTKIHQCIMLCWYMMDFDPFQTFWQHQGLPVRGVNLPFSHVKRKTVTYQRPGSYKIHCVLSNGCTQWFWIPFRLVCTLQRVQCWREWGHSGWQPLYLPWAGGTWPPALPWSCVGKLYLLVSGSRERGKSFQLAMSKQAPNSRPLQNQV